MKRFQVIGRRKRLQKNETPTYGPHHLLSLPTEVLVIVLSQLLLPEWLALTLTCRHLYLVTTHHALYKEVVLSLHQLVVRFLKLVRRNLKLLRGLRTVVVSRPVNNSINLALMLIGSCYSYKLDGINGQSLVIDSINEQYGDLLARMLVECCTGVARVNGPRLHVAVTDISPKFQFPLDVSVAYQLGVECPELLQLLTLVLEQGWHVPFRNNLLSPFGLVEELVLSSMIVDNELMTRVPGMAMVDRQGRLPELQTAAAAVKERDSSSRFFLSMSRKLTRQSTLPDALAPPVRPALRRKLSLEPGDMAEYGLPVRTLTLHGCVVKMTNLLLVLLYFQQCRWLKLVLLRKIQDLVLISSFKGLTRLTVDLGSPFFHVAGSTAHHHETMQTLRLRWLPLLPPPELAMAEAVGLWAGYGSYVNFFKHLHERNPTLEHLQFVGVSGWVPEVVVALRPYKLPPKHLPFDVKADPWTTVAGGLREFACMLHLFATVELVVGTPGRYPNHHRAHWEQVGQLVWDEEGGGSLLRQLTIRSAAGAVLYHKEA